MGRNKKEGLSYFPLDVDFFQDLKIRKLIKYQGCNAISIYAFILCNIYKDGYYIKWDDDIPFIISEQTGYEESYIIEVINCCLDIGLFSKNLFDSERVITSFGIQDRYRKINDLCRRKADISEYMLISSEEKRISSEEKPITSAKSTQRKEKESKGKEIEEKKIEYSTNVELKKDELYSPVDFSRLMDYFNSTFSGKLPSIKSMTDTRKKAIKARVSQYGKKSIEEVFKYVLASDFLLGANDRNWRPDFDWIFKAANYTKILEGNYNGKRNNTMSKRESVSRLKDLSAAILCGSSPKED
ncbi:DUF4373 domain-containing protein [Bacteroides sp.]|uniref:DUF4373 domain-containing protein n=1 Tax=Bacteroides sp. TaxID=29523 RepID=UPI003D0FBA8B